MLQLTYFVPTRKTDKFIISYLSGNERKIFMDSLVEVKNNQVVVSSGQVAENFSNVIVMYYVLLLN